MHLRTTALALLALLFLSSTILAQNTPAQDTPTQSELPTYRISLGALYVNPVFFEEKNEKFPGMINKGIGGEVFFAKKSSLMKNSEMMFSLGYIAFTVDDEKIMQRARELSSGFPVTVQSTYYAIPLTFWGILNFDLGGFTPFIGMGAGVDYIYFDQNITTIGTQTTQKQSFTRQMLFLGARPTMGVRVPLAEGFSLSAAANLYGPIRSMLVVTTSQGFNSFSPQPLGFDHTNYFLFIDASVRLSYEF